MQLKTVEQKLNKLCSQHDEYMALLDITDYLASLKHLTQNNRSNLTKIAQLEQEIQEIQGGHSNYRQQQREIGAIKLQKFKNSIAVIQQKLQDYNGSLFQLELSIKKEEKNSENFAYHQDLNKVNSSIEGLIDKETSALHQSIASFKNDLEQKIIEMDKTAKAIIEGKNVQNSSIAEEQSSRIQHPNDSQSSANGENVTIKDITKRLFKASLQEYDQLMHEIMLFRVKFPAPPLLPFVQHSCEDFRQKISWLYFKINTHERLHPSQFGLLQQECQTLEYRLKALKNHAVCQLLQMYQQSQQKLEVNKLEKQIGSMIKQAQNRLDLFRVFLRKAEDLRKFRELNSANSFKRH